MPSINQALRSFCNLSSDLEELTTVQAQACAEDAAFCTNAKRQLHEHMQTHKIDCMLDILSGKFLCRVTRSTPKALSEEMQELILEEIGKAENEGKLTFMNTEALILDVIRLIQQVRTSKTESLQICAKKPPSVADAVVPTVKEVASMMSMYIQLAEKIAGLAKIAGDTKKELVEKIEALKPSVEEYCRSRNLIKKPITFPRRMSTAFTACVTKFEPAYFSTVKSRKSRRFMQYKQSKARARKISALRPSKKHMVEVLETLTSQQTSGWTHVKLVKTLFERLYKEAEDSIAEKLKENEANPVFKVSLGRKGADDEE